VLHWLRCPGHASTLRCPSHASTLRSPGHASTLRSPGHASTLFCPGHASTLLCPRHASTLLCPGHASTLLCPGHTSTLRCPGHASTLRCPGHGAANALLSHWPSTIITFVSALVTISPFRCAQAYLIFLGKVKRFDDDRRYFVLGFPYKPGSTRRDDFEPSTSMIIH
jgi:hypothetical protein